MRLVVEPLTKESIDSREKALEEFDALCDSINIKTTGPMMTRDELHARD